MWLAGHQTIHISSMRWNFSGMEGVYPLWAQWDYGYSKKAAFAIWGILATVSL